MITWSGGISFIVEGFQGISRGESKYGKIFKSLNSVISGIEKGNSLNDLLLMSWAVRAGKLITQAHPDLLTKGIRAIDRDPINSKLNLPW